MKLPDGRKLGYAEYGNPDGVPLLYFHGFPMSRLEAWGTDAIARNRGIRVIAIDRPGYGLSTYQPNRRIVDWPTDVQDFARHVNLSRFAILGSSGGGPYALACAYALPPDMLLGVGVLSGAGTWKAGIQDVLMSQYIAHLAAVYLPGTLCAISAALMRVVKWAVTTEVATKRVDMWIEGLKRDREEWETPREILTTAQRRERLLRVSLEPFVQGMQATVQETRLLTEDWGFELEDITYSPVRLWHGTKDTNVSIRMARYTAKHIPHSILREFEGENHSSMLFKYETVLLELFPELSTVKLNAKV